VAVFGNERQGASVPGTNTSSGSSARINLKHVSTEIGDRLLQSMGGAFADLYHRNDGGDTDDDAQTRQRRAHPVLPYRPQGNLPSSENGSHGLRRQVAMAGLGRPRSPALPYRAGGAPPRGAACWSSRNRMFWRP